jgi:hypothetical protein
MRAPTVSLAELGKLPLPGLPDYDPCTGHPMIWRALHCADMQPRDRLAHACRAAERWWNDYSLACCQQCVLDISWFWVDLCREAERISRQWGAVAALLERGAEIVP